MAIPKIKTAEFELSVHRIEQLPRSALPEIAFLGRSNVGKSSLINALLGRRKLVRVSAKPGCTRGLNFYLINQRWHFVDLPGFGYARVSREMQAGWGRLLMDYLEQRENLRGVVFLQDGRRRPGEEELFLWKVLTAKGRAVIPVLTKADKLKMGERAQAVRRLAADLQSFGVAAGEVIWFSALTHEGRDKLWRRLLDYLEQ
ncbi:MAG: ribosome biogenesis GTP-binding protein YihA/YsxC [Deltaproteobacteria bacterium]|nr:ribosome biogenesis GTP-binding protein YihA/YsxC [Deltaproteobacteria bacterium]